MSLANQSTYLGHLEGTPIERLAKHQLVSGHASFGDHGERLFSLGVVDLRSKAIACRATRVSEVVTKVPLSMHVVGHVNLENDSAPGG